jgi:hypothetical protein
MISELNDISGDFAMTPSHDVQTPPQRHPGPPPGFVALIYTLLFLAGLYAVTALAGRPAFPQPGEPLNKIVAFFQLRPSAVLFCAAMHFGAAIPLGIFTATIVSRLRFLGVRAAGAYIALFGGFAAAFNMMAASSVMWVMSYPGIAQEPLLVQALYRLLFALGGPGFSVPFGLLVAGVSVTAGFSRLLPKWIVLPGLVLAAAGLLSWFAILFPKALFLIPLTRFPGFLWMIAAGFALPDTVGSRRARQQSIESMEAGHD